MRWTRKGIVAEIQKLHRAGAALNYAAAEAHHLNLMRAAAWHFGTWRYAVESAGIDYNALSRYRRWDRDRIVERIRELHHEGVDLSWRSVSQQVDPALAAAALRPNGFSSWREAIIAAGLDIQTVARYQSWSADDVLREIRALHHAKEPLSSKLVQQNHQSLFCAARRRFGSWDAALGSAGLDVAKIRLRQPAQRSAPVVAIAPRRKSSPPGVNSNANATLKANANANGAIPRHRTRVAKSRVKSASRLVNNSAKSR